MHGAIQHSFARPMAELAFVGNPDLQRFAFELRAFGDPTDANIESRSRGR